MSESFPTIASQLVSIAKGLHSRGWLWGTSGNLSAVVDRNPLRLAITPSGADKGELKAEQILMIDEQCQKLDLEKSGPTVSGKPSDESPLHVAIVKSRGAGAVMHTHSVWTTILSDLHADEGGLAIEGYEMLKGLHGVKTHEHREWIPIIDNSQDMAALAVELTETLSEHSEAHAVLLRRHGLYTWGRDLKEAKRHVEIVEFLFEVIGRSKDLSRGVEVSTTTRSRVGQT